MAKTQRGGQVVKRVARRVKGTAGRAVAKAGRPVRKVQVTLGDLIAAAFDVAGEAKTVAKVVSSRAMAQATGRQIVLVGG
jgi:trehalose utilization protein